MTYRFKILVEIYKFNKNKNKFLKILFRTVQVTRAFQVRKKLVSSFLFKFASWNSQSTTRFTSTAVVDRATTAL